MRSIRPALAAAVVAAAGVAAFALPAPVDASPEVAPGGTCYDTPSATCYLNLDGLLVRQRNARAG